MNMKTQILINTEKFLPTLVLKNTVLFPDIELPVMVSSTTNINAIQRVIDEGGEKVFVSISLKDGVEIERIEESSFYTVGTLCTIHRVEKKNDGSVVAYIKSLYRFNILEVQFEEAFNMWAARGEPLMDVVDLDYATEAALLRSSKEISMDILDALKISKDAKNALENIQNIANFTNLASQNLRIVTSIKQELLETTSVKTRALKLLELLVEQREMIKINKEMGLKISQKSSKAYRETLLREQLKAIKEELGEETDTVEIEGQKQTFKDRIINANLPKDVERIALDQLSRYESMGPQNAESHVIKNYLELILALPWNEESSQDINLDFAQKVLDDEHFGLDKIKEHIIQHLAVMKLSPHKKGSILLFIGPPGVGKTSLGQSIAKALGRKFVRASMGGVRDDSEIRGHRRTYVGSMPGRIIEGIKRAKQKNPVFMLDEIDKLGRGYGGDPASALLEVMDPEQNTTFTDHYLDLPFDLSKVFFIATANSLETIPGPLLDRMEVIQLSGYTMDEKLHIAKNHLLPKQMKEHGLSQEKVIISDSILKKVAEEYTREAGVRNLQRQIAKILRNLSEKFVRDSGKKVIEVMESDLENILGVHKISIELAQSVSMPGVVTGLAWTPVGGDILFIETLMMPGTGKIQLTGKLGEVMSESAHIGLSLVRSKLSTMLPNFDFSKTDFHIHVPSGSIPKDGPSAGITIFTALCSLVLQKIVDPQLAMTGEITLRGAIMPVGGIKEKILAAHRAGIKKIIISKKNEIDLKEIPEKIIRDMDFFFVSNISELLNNVFGDHGVFYTKDKELPPPSEFENLNFNIM